MAPRTRTVPGGSLPSLLVTIALLTALLLPGTASAGGWTALDTAAPNPGAGRSLSSPQLAADASGNQVAVWVEGPSPYKVAAAFRPAGGGWATPQTLDSGATTVPSADLAADGSGNFIVVFSWNTGPQAVKAAYLPSGSSSFGSVESVKTGSTAGLSSPAVDFDGGGRAFLVYEVSTLAPAAWVRSAGPGGTWSPAGGFGAITSGTGSNLVVGATGEATMVDVSGGIRFLRRDAAGGNWTVLAGGGGNAGGRPQVEIDDQGRVTALYLRPITTTQIVAQTCTPTTGGTCAASNVFPAVSGISNASGPALAVTPGGDALAAWAESDGSPVRVSRRSGFGGTWTSPQQLGTGLTPAVVFGSSGAATALFQATGSVIDFARAPVASAFALPSSTLTGAGSTWVTPQLAADGIGDVFGLWVESSGAGIQAAVFDVQPPSIQSLSAPTTAVATEAATFTASASDTWGAISYAWDFGDGGTGTGASTTHMYSAAGTYTARLTATDAAGNQSAQTQTVTVAAAPAQTSPDPTTPPATLEPPVLGESINVVVLKEPIFIKLPGERAFQRLLVKEAHLPNGTVINARRGRVRVVVANKAGGTESARFYGGVFEVNQPKKSGIANIFLNGGGFKGCAKAPGDPHAQVARKRRKRGGGPHRSVRHLWAAGKGRFRTVGRFSAASIRGTKWLTDDRCDGTLTRVKRGVVVVRDFVRDRTVVIRARPRKARHRYFARARGAKGARKPRRSAKR